jgi:uncharacterized protein (DUF362 family)/glycosyltransferase involved in cell wall biosynthesis
LEQAPNNLSQQTGLHRAGKPLVSVIVPTYNSASTLNQCLRSIQEQTYENIELIVVDNLSRDATAQIAKQYNAKFLSKRALRSEARNLGADIASGQLLLFVDADMDLTPQLIQECVQVVERVGFDALMIPEIRIGEGFWAKCRALERITYVGNPLIESIRLVKTRVFKQVAGFDEGLEAGEDWDLHARVEDAGFRIGQVKACIRHHEGYVTLSGLATKRYHYGKSLRSYLRKQSKRAAVQFLPIRMDYIRQWRYLAHDPLHAAGMIFMRAVEYYATALGMITNPGSTTQSSVIVVHIKTISSAMNRLIDQLHMPKKAQKICIKLNLCEYKPWESGAVSDPNVVSSLLSALRTRYPDAKISLIENDATGVVAANIFRYHGFDEVAKRFGADTIDLSQAEWVSKHIDGIRFHTVQIPKILDECDLYITHPKLKTHGGCMITCSLKNQFGLIRTKNKISFHKFLDDAIVDVNLARTPDISIVDANLCMEGNGGPTFGTPKKVGLLIGGDDMVATDSFCAKLVGFNPLFVGHIRKAAKKRLGNMDYNLAVDEPDDWGKYRFQFNRILYYALRSVRRTVRQ